MKLPKNIYTLADVIGLIARKTSGYNPETMQGACFALSTALANAVNLFGFGRADVEIYKRATSYMHAWTRVSFGTQRPWKTAVVDLTFTQYEFDAPHVYVVNRESKEFDGYLKKVGHGTVFTDGVVHTGTAARIEIRSAGINASAFDTIVKRIEGLA